MATDLFPQSLIEDVCRCSFFCSFLRAEKNNPHGVLFVSKRTPCRYFLLFFIFLPSCEPFSVFKGTPCDTVVDAENWCLERL